MARSKRSKLYTLRIRKGDTWEVTTIDNKSIAIDKAIYAVMFDTATNSQVLLDNKFVAVYKSGIDYTNNKEIKENV